MEKFSLLLGMREEYAANRHNTDRFNKSLRAARNKFDVVAKYCREDLFAGINDPKDEESQK